MKPGTFTQIYAHIIFAVRARENILNSDIRSRVFEYISGIIKSLKHKPIIVGGFSDHIYILVSLNPSVSISDTVHDIKRSSSIFINENKLVNGRFSWQDGYGCFTCSKSQVDNVYKYIENQEAHHSKRTFRQEYVSILDENTIDYKPEFLFEFYDLWV